MSRLAPTHSTRPRPLAAVGSYLCAALVILPLCLLLCSYKGVEVPTIKIRYDTRTNLHMDEPSDIVRDSTTGNLYIVGDDGWLYECNAQGHILRTAPAPGVDYEGVELRGDTIYVADERGRQICCYKKTDLSLLGSVPLPYGGPPNKAFEGIAWNEAKHCFAVVIEKEPTLIWELDSNLHPIKEYPFPMASDLSGVRWHNGYMYLLSDEDACVLKCDPNDYTILEKIKINVINPEGICFVDDSTLLICSDDMQELYTFHNFP